MINMDAMCGLFSSNFVVKMTSDSSRTCLFRNSNIGIACVNLAIWSEHAGDEKENTLHYHFCIHHDEPSDTFLEAQYTCAFVRLVFDLEARDKCCQEIGLCSQCAQPKYYIQKCIAQNLVERYVDDPRSSSQ